MAQSDKAVPELVRAAQALEDDIVRLEAVHKSLRKIRLNSEKSITRAAKELNDAVALPERLATGLQALAAAMAQMQARQQAASASRSDRTTQSATPAPAGSIRSLKVIVSVCPMSRADEASVIR